MRRVISCFLVSVGSVFSLLSFFFFFNDTATTEIYTLSLHDALPILIVVGGRNSANTARLTEAALEECARTCQIESAEELEGLHIPPGAMVGVTAGASTPGWVIDEVVGILEKALE